MTEPSAKKSRVVHYGPSTTTVPGFATGHQVLRSVPDAGEDWGEDEDDVDVDEDDDELTLDSEVDVEEGIIDDDDDDDDDEEFDDGLEDDDYDELAD